MNFITAKKGTAHFTSDQFRTVLTSINGNGSHIADLYEKLVPEISTNNIIKIRSGYLMHHGGVFIVEQGTYDEVTLQNGTQGMKRIDLIVARYMKNSETGIESGEWAVIQGTPAVSNPAVPTYTIGDMQNGDLVDDCPVFEIHLDGLNVTEVKRLLEVSPSIPKIANNLSNPNLLINGDFQVWQRGETVSISNDANRHYTCDRWAVNSVYVNVSKVVNGLKFGLLNTEVDYIYQAMERPLKTGEEYTVSYSLNDTIKTKTFVGGQYFDFGVGNGIRYSTVNGHEAIFVQLHKDDILNWVKLEQGSIATPFVPRLYAEEFLMCQRYCQVQELSALVPFGYGIFTDSRWFRMTFPLTVPMRVTPTFKYTGGYLSATIQNRATQETMFEVSVQCYSGNSVTIVGRITNDAAKQYEFTTLIHYDASTNRKVIFEAEIY